MTRYVRASCRRRPRLVGVGYANGLVKLGSIASGVDALANQRGHFTATIDRAD